ncbi:glycosyltransferase family protein [Candidatus Thiosymbion oneisti]|uniref:glycosyltransferase family protein n=1 Tax=Candidatus Thiosymbion oneisti TaxID=589554 RepID=UPI000AC4A82C|nr:glycosyltransferase [Candidatus Thiosymbion oneisti]
MKKLVFILGMHRSGTSMLAQAIDCLGISIPGSLLPAMADNPNGYWEPRELVALNNHTLEALGRPWWDDRPFEQPGFADEQPGFLRQAVPLLEGWLASGDIIALKDPRLCRLLPLWSEAAHRLGISSYALVTVRHPLKVAESLRRRWQDEASRPAAVVQGDRSILLWLRYLLEAEQHSQAMPRAWLTYEDLLHAPVHGLRRGLDTLGISPPRAVGEAEAELTVLVDPSHQRSHLNPGVTPEYRIAEACYERVRRSAGCDLDKESREYFAYQSRVLSAIHDRFGAVRGSTPAAYQADPWAPRMVHALTNRVRADELRPPKGVLFVTGAPLSRGHLYRVQYRIEALTACGIPVSVLPAGSPQLMTQASDAGLVLVYRCEWDAGLSRLYRYCRRVGIPLGFDIDDLVFEPDYMTPDYFDYLRRPEVSEADWYAKSLRYRQALLKADFAILPTEPLRRAAHPLVRDSFVIPNGLDRARLAAAARLPEPADSGEGLRLGYASGTPTHQRDFGTIVEPLVEILDAHRRVSLIILGDLELHAFPQILKFGSRIERRPKVAFEELPNELSRFDINLAPLEAGNPFCEAKSELKYFEAALVGVPTLATATPPMRSAILQGETGYCCDSKAQWRSWLDRLIRDDGHRAEIGRRARSHALTEYGPDAQRDVLLSVLAEALGRYPKGRTGQLIRAIRKAFA